MLKRGTTAYRNRIHPHAITDEAFRSNSCLISRRRLSRLLRGNEFTGHALLADEPVADRQAPALLPTASSQDASTILVRHTSAEPVRVTPLPPTGLIGTFHVRLRAKVCRVKPFNIGLYQLCCAFCLDCYAQTAYFASISPAGIAQLAER